MPVSTLNSRTGRPAVRAGCTIALLAAAAALIAPAIGAQLVPAEGTYIATADTVTSDFRSNTVELSGNVRVSQGPMFIEAGAATGTDFGSRNGRLTFRDSVHVRTDEADLHANSASAAVVNGGIAQARVQGSPAEFEQRAARTDRRVRGRADVIEYDFSAGIVKFTDQVWFSNGKDEFRGDVVIYNVRDERLQINPGGQSRGRVRGIIRPRERTEAPSEPSADRSTAAPTTADPIKAERGA